jgi:hypothetical protein
VEKANGQAPKTCIFTDASDAPVQALCLNSLKVPWGKENQMILTVEMQGLLCSRG